MATSDHMEMTVSARQPVTLSLRRHTDPPFLWLIVLSGSLFLNIILAFAVHHYLQQVERQSVKLAPIAIQFLPSPKATAPNTSRRAIAPSAKTTLIISNPSTASTSINPTPNSSASNISLSRKATFQRKQAKPASSTSRPLKARSPQTPNTQASSTSESTSQTSSTESTDDPVTSKVGLPAVPPVPDNSSEVTSSAVPGVVSVNADASPAKFSLQMRILGSDDSAGGDRASSTPSQLVKKMTSGEAGCLLTPAALHQFDQPVNFDLTLDAKGTVVDVVSSVQPDTEQAKSYQDLVACTLKTLTLNSTSSANFIHSTELRKISVRATLTKQ